MLGLRRAGLEANAGLLWWAGISAAWGLVLVDGLFIFITVISGP
ncbi:hypothetical protein [Arthrobacter sp. AET 35A]|nr:hypothetical protein [Arthrobacter sp. AET 35A]